MSVIYNANGEYLSQTSITSTINYNSSYTLMTWYYPVAHHATVNLGFLWFSNTAITTYDVMGQESTSNGEQMYVGDNVSGFDYGAGAIAAATWHHVAMVRSSSTLMRGYINGVQVGTDRTGNVSGRAAATRTYIGSPLGSYHINARYTHIKLWRCALTPEEIQKEMQFVAPVTNLSEVISWWPMLPDDRKQVFGLEYPWTENGTLSDAADPGIRWKPAPKRPQVWWLPLLPTYEVTLTAEMEPLTYAGLVVWPVKQLLRTLVAGLTPTATLSALLAFARTLTAGLTPAANLVKNTARTLTAEMEPLTYAGLVVWPVKQLLRTLTAEMEPLTYAGLVVWPVKQLLRTLVAGLTPTATLSALLAFARTLTAGLTPAANLVKNTARTLTAEMEPLTYTALVSWPVKQLLRTLTAGLTPTATLNALKAFLRTLTAGLTPTATLSTLMAFIRTLTAGLTPTANLVKGTLRTLTAEMEPLTYTGPVKQLLRTLVAGLTPTATLASIRAYLVTLTASLTPDGSLVRRIERTLQAGLMPAASVIRLLVGSVGGRARCTLTIEAATVAGLTMVNATSCGLEMSEV